MAFPHHARSPRRARLAPTSLLFLLGLVFAAACAPAASTSSLGSGLSPAALATKPSPDPRVGLRAGMFDAAEAVWNLRVLSKTQPPERFRGITNSDLAFTGKYAIQGNYNGWVIWDISNPNRPTLKTAYVCPASQSDVSVYKNLLFISGEGLTGRIDCGTEGVRDTVSNIRLRGLRIFDITDIENPKNVGNVQTCRGSHTHTVLEDPNDKENVYVYISGSAGIRSPSELPGCVRETPDQNPNSALFRIEVIKVPVKDPAKAAIVSSPRIFNDLTAPPRHGEGPADIKAREEAVARAKAAGGFTGVMQGSERVLTAQVVRPLLDSVVKARGGAGVAAATSADSAALRAALPGILARMFLGNPGGAQRPGRSGGPTQCHDITVYPGIGLAGGACEGYGLLLDIKDPANPKRISAVADSNFSYWHSATFNNDGTKVLFTDEWGGGSQPKCRVGDPMVWGANALFTIENDNRMVFKSYYKMPAPQTSFENCVAHNGSLIPIPGRDVMVQSWYQGGISIFDWTDVNNAVEIAYHDRGPSDATRQGPGGSWSVYWYNGVIVSSEIARGLDIFELAPSAFITQNEIDAAKTVHYDYLNAQGQPKMTWPASFALARAYVDQLERTGGLAAGRIVTVRTALSTAESASGAARRSALESLATSVDADARGSKDSRKVRMLGASVRDLAAVSN